MHKALTGSLSISSFERANNASKEQLIELFRAKLSNLQESLNKELEGNKKILKCLSFIISEPVNQDIINVGLVFHLV